MKKRLVLAVIAVMIIICWGIGTYFIDFALKRGTSDNPQAVPPAVASILDKNAGPKPKPDFPAEEWTIKTGEERFATAFIAPNNTNRWVILVHGYGRNQTFFWDYANEYLKRGYNVLTPDLNASGKSGGRYLTMGIVESEEILLWIKELNSHYPNAKIVLHGVSMGAATVMMTTAKTLPENVIAAVEDCGYVSAYDMFSELLNKMYGLPAFPVMNIVNVVGRVKMGCFLSDAAPIKAVGDTKIPMLFIHGDADKLVDVSNERKLYEASSAPIKDEYIVHGVGHADSMKTDKEEYFKRIIEFAEKNQSTN